MQKVIIVYTGHTEDCQEKVNKALEKLGAGWRIISASSSLSTYGVGGTLVDGMIYANVVTTILVEEIHARV